MRRYIDADKLQEVFKELHGGKRSLLIDTEQTADVRENVRATLRDDHGNYRCTNCNALISDEIDYVLEDYKPIQFCPNCGAQMVRGEQE